MRVSKIVVFPVCLLLKRVSVIGCSINSCLIGCEGILCSGQIVRGLRHPMVRTVESRGGEKRSVGLNARLGSRRIVTGLDSVGCCTVAVLQKGGIDCVDTWHVDDSCVMLTTSYERIQE